MTENDLRTIAAALTTAEGCLDLVQQDIKPIDLDLCAAEVHRARQMAYDALRDKRAFDEDRDG
jgi:hypothetical protein